MKRTSVHPEAKIFAGDESKGYKQPDQRRANKSRPDADPRHDLKDGDSTHDQLPLRAIGTRKVQGTSQGGRRDARHRRNHGPDPAGPGIPALIAGGLALWPKAFGKLESWLDATTQWYTVKACNRSTVS